MLSYNLLKRGGYMKNANILIEFKEKLKKIIEDKRLNYVLQNARIDELINNPKYLIIDYNSQEYQQIILEFIDALNYLAVNILLLKVEILQFDFIDEFNCAFDFFINSTQNFYAQINNYSSLGIPLNIFLKSAEELKINWINMLNKHIEHKNIKLLRS